MAKLKRFFFHLSWIYLVMLFFAVIVSFFWSAESLRPSVENIFKSPSADYILGTDSLGRDLFRRIILGARTSLFVGLLGAIFSTLIGTILGFISSMCRGWIDQALMGLSHLFLALPQFALLAVFSLLFQQLFSGFDFTLRILFSLTMAMSLTHWMSVLRVVRSQVLQIQQFSFLEAARALGGTSTHILWNHIWPSVKPTVWIVFALQIPSSLMSESFMSFVGLGVQAPMTSWGALVSEGWRGLSTYPHLILAPSLAIFLTVFSFHHIINSLQSKAAGAVQPP